MTNLQFIRGVDKRNKGFFISFVSNIVGIIMAFEVTITMKLVLSQGLGFNCSISSIVVHMFDQDMIKAFIPYVSVQPFTNFPQLDFENENLLQKCNIVFIIKILIIWFSCMFKWLPLHIDLLILRIRFIWWASFCLGKAYSSSWSNLTSLILLFLLKKSIYSCACLISSIGFGQVAKFVDYSSSCSSPCLIIFGWFLRCVLRQVAVFGLHWFSILFCHHLITLLMLI